MIALAEGDWCTTSGAAIMARSGEHQSTFTVTVRNPLAVEAQFRVESPDAAGWSMRTEPTEFTLKAGRSREVPVLVRGPEFEGTPPEVKVGVALLYELKSGIVQPVRVSVAVPIELEEVGSVLAVRPKKNKVLVLDGAGCVRVPLDWRWNALTLECWARGPAPKNWLGLIAKTQQSGFSLNWIKPSPQGNVRIAGHSGYTEVSGKAALDWNEWYHIAFCWDGEESRIYVDGRLKDRTAASGTLHSNRLPLFIGADTTSRGNPEHSFTGAIDEVRISNVARYKANFRPPKRHEPDEDAIALFHFDNDLDGLFPDASGNANHGWRVGTAKLAEERVR